MFCSKCGKEIAEDSLFCSYCGVAQTHTNALHEPDSGADNQAAHPAPPDSPPVAKPHAPSLRERIVSNLILIFILLLIVGLCYALSGNFIFEGLNTVLN